MHYVAKSSYQKLDYFIFCIHIKPNYDSIYNIYWKPTDETFVTYSLMITVFVAYYHLEESQFGENFEHHIGLTSTE
jgi:hypothetical protein